MSFFEELKRRNVFRVAMAYVILAWLMTQVAELLLETFGAPDWVLKSLLALFLVGFPFALFFAWAFEMTPEGIRKEKDVDRSQSITPQTGHKLDRTIIAVLALALGYFAWDKFVDSPGQSETAALVGSESVETVALESALPTDKSIAVLPFDNRSNQEDDEFFTTGIHDDLLTQLAQISSLRVISRTSVVQFKDTSKSIREIAEMLGVATILEGGVQRAGSQVRINMQLIDATTDAHLWAQTFDRELTTNNIFAIQSEIATSVAAAMRATLSPDEQTRIADVPTQNMEALEEYFKGRAELDQRTLPAIESARMRFERARRLDPEFALALAGEALAIMLLSDGDGSYGDIPNVEANAMARPLLENALRMAPNDAQVLAIFGLLEGSEDNLAAELDYYERSLRLNPSSGEVLNWNQQALYDDGRIKESVDAAYRMVEVDPMSMVTLYNGIFSMMNTPKENTQHIEVLLKRLVDLDPGYGLMSRAGVEWQRGNIPEAARLYYQVLEIDPGRTSSRNSLTFLLLLLGFSDEAAKVAPDSSINMPKWNGQWQQALRVDREKYARDPTSLVITSELMNTLLLAGETDEAFALAQNLWTHFGSNPYQLKWALLDMAWVAGKTEHPTQARLYRDAASQYAQTLIEAGVTDVNRYLFEAALAALDHRQDDAIKAISLALDNGSRWHYMPQVPVFESLRDNPGFQAQVSRLRDLIDAEAREIRAMLCGPDSILTSWEPASGTCT